MANQASSTTLKSTCHCGAIELIIPYLPADVNECQCTICRRYAAAWAYYKLDEVTINKTGELKKYIWGDKEISFNFCDTCGCMCFWYPEIEGKPRIGVNTRMMDPEDLKHVTRRVTWNVLTMPLGDRTLAHPQDKAVYRET